MIKNKWFYLIGKFYGLVFLAIIGLCIFYRSDWKKVYLMGNEINIVLGIIVYIFSVIVSICFLKWKEKDEKKWNRRMMAVTILIGMLLFFISLQYCFRTGWDVHRMLRNASLIAEGKTNKLNHAYYSRCPNNIFLTCIFSLAYRVADYIGISDGYYVLLVLQGQMFAWAGYFIYRSADLYFNEEKKKYSIATWIIFLLLVGFSPWIVIPYSDSVAVFLISICAFLLSKFYQGNHEYRYIFLIAFFGTIGYAIKPQIFIFLLAFVIISCISNLKSIIVDFKRTAKKIIVFLFAVIIAIAMVQGTKMKSGFQLNPEAELGIPHFLMMGMHAETRGVYYRPDVDYSISFQTKEERKEGNIKVIKERIGEMGWKGMIKHICEKNLLNYNDGTFAWGVEGNFYDKIDTTGFPALRKILSSFYYNEGSHYAWFEQFMQIIWMGTIFLNIFSMSSAKDKRISIWMLSILGLTLFETLFEARARYLFGYVPIYILLAMVGLSQIEERIRKCRQKLKK